ncbi:MAG: hypothetical protein ACK5Y2_07105 [Bdellovibrionales bacterium]
MKEEHLRKLILFYFFVTLDELRAKELARKSWLWCQKKKLQDKKINPDTLVLLSLHEGWDDLKNVSRSGVSKYSLDAGWRLPGGISLEPWKAFYKEASEEEIFVTALIGVLRYSVPEIVEALGLSSGTIRYRLAKASRRMGHLLLQSGANP